MDNKAQEHRLSGPAAEPTSRPGFFLRAFNSDNRWQTLMFVFCVLFGLTLIAETQGAGDGTWLLYAAMLRQGHLLYSQMHLALQPLFVLEAAYFQRLLGYGWMVSKVPAVLHLIAYCIALRLLVRRSQLSDIEKAVVFGCGFFFPLGFDAYRFDDYHVLADCFQLYALLALLALPRAVRSRDSLLLASALGVLCGLSLTTRLNDGAALVVGVVLGIAVLTPARRMLSLTLFGAVAALTVVVVVHFTGDSLRDYATYSIFRAAGSKGGAGSVLVYPLSLPVNTARWLLHNPAVDLLSACVFVCGMAWALLIRPIFERRGRTEWIKATVGTALTLLAPPWMKDALLSRGRDPGVPLALLGVTAVMTLLACLLGAMIIVRLLRWLARSLWSYEWDRCEILLLIPIGQMASGSMSSGGVHYGLYGTLGILGVIFSICPAVHVRKRWARSFAVAVLAILVASTAIFKYKSPYSWHTYREHRLFTGRVLYRHPVYGPMVIDKDLLAFIQPVCEKVHTDAAQPQLLSLPYSYANYFCAVPPWKGYVQTFFDTSTKETIQGLMGQLQSAPPQWILYQRQLATLILNEKAYNHGRPLEQRFLDEMIEQKVQQGQWRVVYSSDYGNTPEFDNHWMLIQTVP